METTFQSPVQSFNLVLESLTLPTPVYSISQITLGKTLMKKHTVVWLCLQKAFDIVNHNVLLAKFKAMGFNELSVPWIQSY